MNKLYYDYGLPFSKKLAPVLDVLKDRVIKQNKASFFIVDGSVGSGKSVGAVQFADYLNGGYILKEDGTYERDESKFIDLKTADQYSLGAPDFMKKLVSVYKKGLNVVIYDEAGDFSKRGSLTKLNQDLNRIFEVCRAFKILIIIVLPNFYYIDRSVLDKEMIRALIRVTRDNDKYSDYKLWDIWGLNWIKWRSLKLPIPNQCYFYQTPIHNGNILPLSPERLELLDKISSRNKINLATDISEKSRIPERGIKKRDLAELYGVSVRSIERFLIEYEIKPINVIKSANYYNELQVKKAVDQYGLLGVGGKR
jgi:hypothetical protein